jgi:hypothetical protein
MRLIIGMADCMLNGHGVKEASYYESRMSVLEGSAWHSPVDLPIHPVTRLVIIREQLLNVLSGPSDIAGIVNRSIAVRDRREWDI